MRRLIRVKQLLIETVVMLEFSTSHHNPIQSPELIARGFLAFSVIQNQPTALTHSLSGMDTGDAIPYTQ